MPSRAREVEDFLFTLETPNQRLSTWECDFIENMTNKFEAGEELTEKQFECLKEMAEKKG